MLNFALLEAPITQPYDGGAPPPRSTLPPPLAGETTSAVPANVPTPVASQVFRVIPGSGSVIQDGLRQMFADNPPPDFTPRPTLQSPSVPPSPIAPLVSRAATTPPPVTPIAPTPPVMPKEVTAYPAYVRPTLRLDDFVVPAPIDMPTRGTFPEIGPRTILPILPVDRPNVSPVQPSVPYKSAQLTRPVADVVKRPNGNSTSTKQFVAPFTPQATPRPSVWQLGDGPEMHPTVNLTTPKRLSAPVNTPRQQVGTVTQTPESPLAKFGIPLMVIALIGGGVYLSRA